MGFEVLGDFMALVVERKPPVHEAKKLKKSGMVKTTQSKNQRLLLNGCPMLKTSSQISAQSFTYIKYLIRNDLR